MQSKIYRPCGIFRSGKIEYGKCVEIKENRLTTLIDEKEISPDFSVIDLPDVILSPGFIDTQINGGGGILANTANNSDEIAEILQAQKKFGTAVIFPTFITDQASKLEKFISLIADCQKNNIRGIFGAHFEGPFINPQKRGTHRQEFVRRINNDDWTLLEKHRNTLEKSIFTIAPEFFSNTEIRRLSSISPLINAGHTLATAEDIVRGKENGLRGITHLMNAMPAFSAREPSIFATAAALDLFAGIISDGIHSSVYSLFAAGKVYDARRLMLVTDAMSPLGADISEFDLLGIKVKVAGKKLVNAEGNLAGANTPLIECAQIARNAMRFSNEEVLQMLVSTPSEYLQMPELAEIINRPIDEIVAVNKADFSLVTNFLAHSLK
ncbi:MAG: N-acetylglucosamine-6-phosphate deacetylase [Cardiobacteriaceae bacterium]|nr:N-acetylglucosamine-6-phosphate deacetylase [Cardiobacteriaceae bacterium]